MNSSNKLRQHVGRHKWPGQTRLIPRIIPINRLATHKWDMSLLYELSSGCLSLALRIVICRRWSLVVQTLAEPRRVCLVQRPHTAWHKVWPAPKQDHFTCPNVCLLCSIHHRQPLEWHYLVIHLERCSPVIVVVVSRVQHYNGSTNGLTYLELRIDWDQIEPSLSEAKVKLSVSECTWGQLGV